MILSDWINNIRWKYFTNSKSGLIFKELMKEFWMVEQMTENKRFKIVNDCGDYHLMNGDEQLGYDLCSYSMRKTNWNNVVDKLNEQEELIKRLKEIREEQIETILKQKRKIKELTTQLQTEEESVCIKCKHHYLIKHPLESREFYISKCIKEHKECSKEDIRYCEDFELTGDDYDE